MTCTGLTAVKMEAIAETDSAFWRPSRQPNNGFHGEGEGREDPLGKIFIVIIIGFLFVCLILSWHFWVGMWKMEKN